MILWISGNTGSGKTTLARILGAGGKGIIHLDGDDCRETINRGLGMGEKDRRENCLRIAWLAKLLADQGHSVVVSVIAPYVDLRKEIQGICGCRFVYLLTRGAGNTEETPYELPDCMAGKEFVLYIED